MARKTPSFWYPQSPEQLSLQARSLKPISWLYKFGFRLHQGSVKAQKAHIPVICIGNLSAGGTGKTPTCISFMRHVKDAGIAKNPFFLIRGYGGAERGPLIVDLEKHNAWDVGDEPLILARHASTIISADRYEGTNLAALNGADLVIMDDGLQNPGIQKDLKIIVINGEMGFGNGLMIPAGPLREPLDEGLAKADAFFLIGEDTASVADILPKNIPVFYANLEADANTLPSKSKDYIAFAGLGYPKKFFDFLKYKLGYNIIEEYAFADHCPYTRKDLQILRQKAKDAGAQLLTTEKDFLRLPGGYKGNIHTISVSMCFENPEALQHFIAHKILSLTKEAA